MPALLSILRPQHVLLAIALVSLMGLLITLRSLQCPSCDKLETSYYEVLEGYNNQKTKDFGKKPGVNRLPVKLSHSELIEQDIHKSLDEDTAPKVENNNAGEVVQETGSRALKDPNTSQKESEEAQGDVEESKTPIEKLCRGFKEEQAKRVAAIKRRCNERHKRFAQLNQKDPLLTRRGPTRVYLHHNRSLMWCETPKAISTSWGRAVFALEGRDTRDANMIYVHLFLQERLEFLSPSIFTMDVFKHVPHFDTYKKLLFLRDPFTRIHSAYMDKIFEPFLPYHNLVESINRELRCNFTGLQQECLQSRMHAEHRRAECVRLIEEHGANQIMESPGLRDIIRDLLGFEPDPKTFSVKTCNRIAVPDCSSEAVLRDCSVNLTAVPTFPEFVQYIVEARDARYSMDRHWSPMSLNCAPCTIPYTRIIRFESTMRDVECVLREIYPPESYAKLETPTHYGIENDKLVVIKAPNSTKANGGLGNRKSWNLTLAMETFGALRPRERDYNFKTIKTSARLRENYEKLSPSLMMKLWDFYRDDMELLGYQSEPDFGLEKFRALHSQ